MSEPFLANPAHTKARRSAAAEPARNKHQRKTAETKGALLKAARRIFARDGFEACRIEDIAAAAGYTRGAFYAHFESKEELFFALLQEEIDRHVGFVHAIVSGCETVERRLVALREHYVKCIGDRDWGLLMLEFKLFAVRHPKLRPRLAATHRQIRNSMKLGMIEKMLGVDRKWSEPRSAALEALREALFLEHAYDPERLSEKQAAIFLGDLFDFLLSGIRP